MRSFDYAVGCARANVPIKIECRRDPLGFVIHDNNGDHVVYDIEPQESGGFFPPAERLGTPVAEVDLDGKVRRYVVA